MKKNVLRILVTALLAGMLITACAGPANTLLGSWRSAATAQQPAQTLEFRQDGSLVRSSQGMTVDFVYQLTGDNLDTLLVKTTKDAPASQDTSLKFTINGDTLILDASGQTQNYTRLK
jgi:hypothetical protein